ncbi:3'(2'),5'-bisphosphate nucleotidase CysQ [Rhodophyticola sp. CCM32]|uniref:3'(2'),5'-bisphosphate nucleotidase CysQ n=1 Tax=Rhodophyticola sp. CCM32 TaxID=2916397 RepID=UPI00107FCFF2|nr:3'(2'),5'-bisphosphate nucleotidase CysQ [Rhodophyticola sp. CCM32]QBY01828.1 3'(2'),5'-bisphosphate nucleotidase CysQ [Rhodophyticola sp. CCM32]
MPGPESDLTLLITAAEDAGRIAAKHWKSDPKVWDKPDGEGPVTAADLEVDEMLRTTLSAARPDYGWLSEETPDTATRLSRRRTFIVDPIDGTRAFIDGSRNFAHSLAISDQGQITAAVVYLPVKEQLFAAALGQGATLNGTPLEASAREKEHQAAILTTKVNLAPARWPGGVPPVEPHFRSSLAYRLALVGQGRFDGMITLRDSWEWDIAAGALIAAEAGAAVSTRTGAALHFNNPLPQLPGILAAAPRLHHKLLARLTLTA